MSVIRPGTLSKKHNIRDMFKETVMQWKPIYKNHCNNNCIWNLIIMVRHRYMPSGFSFTNFYLIYFVMENVCFYKAWMFVTLIIIVICLICLISGCRLHSCLVKVMFNPEIVIQKKQCSSQNMQRYTFQKKIFSF